MLPEHYKKYCEPDDWTDSDTGQTDSTKYFTLPLRTTRYLNQLFVDVVDTPGASGTNTYTVERTINDGVSWVDITLAWYGVANFTTSFSIGTTFPTLVDSIRVKRVRTGDLAASDGGSAVSIGQGRF